MQQENCQGALKSYSPAVPNLPCTRDQPQRPKPLHWKVGGAGVVCVLPVTWGRGAAGGLGGWGGVCCLSPRGWGGGVEAAFHLLVVYSM